MTGFDVSAVRAEVELDPSGAGGSTGQGGSGSSAAPSSPGGAADLDLDAIEARADAASVGPWHRIYDRVITADYDDEADPDFYASMQRRCTVAKTHPFEMRISRDPKHIADAAFIAAARTDVPALVAEVRRLTAENEQLRGGECVDLDAIEARVASVAAMRPHLMSMRGSDLGQTLRDVPALLAEVRALRAEVAALNAETRARCERIRAVLDRK